tara:strand:+ start:931 stop:1188 length:258 start_codon:yes stop_codon:yes gene_type:complete
MLCFDLQNDIELDYNPQAGAETNNDAGIEPANRQNIANSQPDGVMEASNSDVEVQGINTYRDGSDNGEGSVNPLYGRSRLIRGQL